MMLDAPRVYVLAYVLYFKRASWRTKLSCGLRLLRHRLFQARAPISVMIGLTHRCQCTCVHCGMDLEKVSPADELTLQEVASVIRQAREMGAVEITLFGGEPLLRDDIEEIVRLARAGRMLCSLDTNGLLLSPEKIRALITSGLSAVKISLDSSLPDEHDRMRGVNGCFEKAVDAARECAAQGLPCVISTYASRENVRSGDLEKVIKLARGLGVDAVRIIDTTLSGCSLSAAHRMLSPEDRERLAGLLEPGFVFLENLASGRKLRHPICSALAKRYIYVSPRGDVQPCCFVPLSFGNVRDEPLKDLVSRIWGSSLMKHDRNQCLMNNPEFRRKHLAAIESAERLPVMYDQK